MFGSTKLGKFFGIDTYVHGTFWLLPLYVLFGNLSAGAAQLAFSLLFVFAVFFCIALHEVGHALAARAYGIRTRDITLYPIGGIASLEGMPSRPWREVAVALAGPAVNLVIALGLSVGLVTSELVMPWERGANVLAEFLGQLFVANVLLCVFNLLPAFPMDGGRVLRAVLANRMDRVRATETAVKVGSVVAGFLLIGGLLLLNFSLILIALAVWFLGQGELVAVRFRDAARRYGLYDSPAEEPERTPLPVDPAADLASRSFSGVAWDGKRGIWVRWVNGRPVSDVGV
jgi:Zn-dependent protease